MHCTKRHICDLCNVTTMKSINFSFIHSHINMVGPIRLYGSTRNEHLDNILKCKKKQLE